MTRSEKSYIKILRNSNTEFVYSCTFFKRMNIIRSFLPQAVLSCSIASSPSEHLFNTFQGPVPPEDVKTDTLEPVCSYRLLTYKTSYQFLEVKRERTSFSLRTEPAPLSKDSTSWKLNHGNTTCLKPYLQKNPYAKSKY